MRSRHIAFTIATGIKFVVVIMFAVALVFLNYFLFHAVSKGWWRPKFAHEKIDLLVELPHLSFKTDGFFDLQCRSQYVPKATCPQVISFGAQAAKTKVF